jgi:hypothetical protein
MIRVETVMIRVETVMIPIETVRVRTDCQGSRRTITIPIETVRVCVIRVTIEAVRVQQMGSCRNCRGL